MKTIHDPNLVFYADLAKHDGGLFMSDDAHGHLCTVTGATWGSQGRYFDGTDDRINLPIDRVLITPTQGEIACWFKATALDDATAHTILGYGGNEASSMGFRLIKDTNYYLNWLGWIAGNLSQVRGGTALSTETWYFVEILSDGSTWSIRLNGEAETLTVMNGTNNGNWFGDDTHVSASLDIGTLRNAAAFAQYAEAIIGRFWIFNWPKTQSEGRNIYLATKWRYR